MNCLKRNLLTLLVLLLTANFLLSQTGTCPAMQVSITAPGLLPCTATDFQVELCNAGTAAANNAELEVFIPKGATYVTAGITPNQIFGNKLRFFLGHFDPGQCTTFFIRFKTPCNAPVGTAFCLNARAYPSYCWPTLPAWDGSHLELESASCGDSVYFTVRNTGIGTMATQAGYVIIEDYLLRTSGAIPILAPLDTFQVVVPPPLNDQATYTFQAMQTPGGPDPQTISGSVEGCGTPATMGYLLQFPQERGRPGEAIFCDTLAASIGGWQKTGFPLGYGPNHQVNPDVRLHYRLALQNTTAQALTGVVITDTLSAWLDLSTLKPGAANRPYTFSLQGQLLTFNFPGVTVPPGAWLVVQYDIRINQDAPLGTMVENQAHWSANGQDGGWTNTTEHQIAEAFILSDTHTPESADDFHLTIIPHPFDASAVFVWTGSENSGPFSFRLFNAAGTLCRTESMDDAQFVFERNGLPAGAYFYQIIGGNGVVHAGKCFMR